MGSEAIQINIPDFDDDDYSSTPLFCRSQPGGLWGASNSGQDSPTILTPLAERSEKGNFHAHARGDSVASEDSAHSIQYTSRKLKTPFAHSAQSSVATTSTSPFTKKSSFASLRNAFKSNKAIDPPPPMPTLDQQAYPVLKNPFNRSATSLAHGGVPPRDRPSMHASPTQFRPSTPNSSDFKFRGTPSSKYRGHSYAKSQHSHSGSLFHFSDGGSDHGHGFSFGALSTPPPVPPVPNPFGIPMPLSESPDLEEERVVVEARTPSEFALHAIFIRFAASAESLMNDFVGRSLEREPRLESVMGPGIDPKFDEVLLSLGKVAEKHAKPVIDSIMRWRKDQLESVGRELQRTYTGFSKATRIQGSASYLTERRSMASIYIMCRALISATQSISKDALPEAVGNSLEELTFDQFRKPDVKMLTQSVNHRTMADLYAKLLGNLAEVRFESVTDRFVTELGPVAAGQIPKDLDFKYENLVKGLKHVQIKVWPPERFEEGAEFLLSFSKFFDNAHGTRLKTVFAETLVHILHPIGKTAQAEVNDPSWAKAIELIYPKAKDMAGKPRYWLIAYQLVVTSLCVAPHELFLKSWQSCFESNLGKLKEKVSRITVMNGSLRLVWTYLYRCNESSSTATSKLESLLKNFFPSNRITIFPQDDRLEPFVYIVHFVLSRYIDYGTELCMELLQERAISSVKASNNNFSSLSSERISIATQAILLSLHLVEREEPTPSWPSGLDFTQAPSAADYPTSSDSLQSPITRPGLQDLLERSSNILCSIATTCFQVVGVMSVLDEQWSTTRLGPTYEEPHNYIIRHHRIGSFAYPHHYSTPLGILQTCYKSWPRCLHSSLPIEDAFEMLLHGVVHVEPAIADAATLAVQRFMADPKGSTSLVSKFCAFMFDPQVISEDGTGLGLLVECSGLLNLWITVLDKWVKEVNQRPKHELTDSERDAISANMDHIEVGALFLLSHWKGPVRSIGVKAIQMLGSLSTALQSEPSSPVQEFSRTPLRVFEALLAKKIDSAPFLKIPEDILDGEELKRLEQWKVSTKPDVILRLADSDASIDRSLWKHVFPAFVQACMEYQVVALLPLRARLVAAAYRYHPFIFQLSGVSNRPAPGAPSRSGSSGEKEGSRLVIENRHAIQQWHLWMKIICATAQVPEVRATASFPIRDHSRGRSEGNLERERMSTTRDLFKYLSQYLDSDHSAFRDVAVSCISSFPAYGYSSLLEDLSPLTARQLYDDSRPKALPTPAGRVRRQERFHTAVARIYYLTAHLIQEQRSSSKQFALSHVLKYIRSMHTFLAAPEHRDLFSLQRLRRYFCGTLERLFCGLAELSDSDRFMPSGMQLALYRMCEEWCQLGKQSDTVKKRLISMQTAAAHSYHDPTSQAELIQRFQTETRALSHAAVAAMAALIQKAFHPSDNTASPVDRAAYEQHKPLEASSTLDRIVAILAAFHEPVQECGKKALRSLLLHGPYVDGFADEVLRRAFVTVREVNTSNARFFEVVANVICTEEHGFKFCQVVCLGMSNLCHPLLEIRRQAFNILETIHEQTSGLISMDLFEAAVGSAAPSTYLHAHRLISDLLSGEHPDQALQVLEQFSGWIPQVYDSRSDRGPLVLLQSLEFWVPNINLMANEKTLSPEGRSAIYHLLSLTSRYAETHAEQILVLWTRVVDEPYQSNGFAIIRFLLDNSHKVGSSVFINCASKVVACLSQSVVGRQLFVELCKVVEPDRMLPSLEYRETLPNAEDLRMWGDLDVLFPEQPKLTLGVAQFALLFLSETTIERYWEMQEQLPCLLHAIFVHLDSRQSFIRQRVRHLLFQILRSCMSGYDDLPDRTSYPTRPELKAVITALEAAIDSKLWKEDDASDVAEPKIKWLATQVLSLLEPLHPKLSEKWGSKALQWGIQCSMRPIAVRSLQFFRSVMPKFRQQDLGMLLGRLSINIADADTSIQKFNVDIILTLTAMATSASLDTAMVPQLFWAAIACLSTTVESEYQHTLGLLEVVLNRVDLDDPLTSELLISQRPPEWKGAASMQSSLLTGLRSSVTSEAAFSLLQQLTQFEDSVLIDLSEGRVRDLYTASLPWCLRAMTSGTVSEELQEFALNIGRLAEMEERPSITRIMTSFAKSRFRTKEDFLRQSVASLREHYGAEYWMEVLTLLMGLVLNNERWLRVHTMQILKVLFQQRETRNPIDRLGSELLMPLLRLLETDLVSEALDVLDEPMLISGGPSAKHVLRMSMHHHLEADVKEVESVAEIFGIAEESGWCVPRSSLLREICRFNMTAVFDTCKVNSRPSRVNFQPEDMLQLSGDDDGADDLGDLVQNLHELSTFFQESRSNGSVPSRQLEARVAAILAKSTDPADYPQTPFVDIFDMGSIPPYEDSDGSSGSDTESDLFEFDSPQISRFASSIANNHH